MDMDAMIIMKKGDSPTNRGETMSPHRETSYSVGGTPAIQPPKV